MERYDSTFGFQFCKESVLESYEHFIENFSKAEKLLDDVSCKSAFNRFVEVQSESATSRAAIQNRSKFTD